MAHDKNEIEEHITEKCQEFINIVKRENVWSEYQLQIMKYAFYCGSYAGFINTNVFYTELTEKDCWAGLDIFNSILEKKIEEQETIILKIDGEI